jgi:hypothetical protein
LLGTHIKNGLNNTVQNGFFTDTVNLPTASFDWTGSPRLELGYRLAQGFGEFSMSYRFLVSEARDTFDGFDLDGGPGFLKSRLNMNVIDLDYGTREFSLGPRWDMKWRVGARLASIYFDSRAVAMFVEQRESNSFFGAGPHAALELNRRFDVPGLGLFARLDGSAVIGKIHQSFEETTVNPDGSLSGGATLQTQTQAVPVLDFQFGLSWTPCRARWSQLVFGYELQQWWYLGQVGSSRAELTTQGIFFRGDFSF